MSHPATSPPAAATEETKDLTHNWVVAATIDVPEKVAKHADFRLSFRAWDGLRVDALETYCKGCRRPYDEVGDQPCSAKVNNEHLIGGDPGVRAKRRRGNLDVLAPGVTRVQAPTIDRRGVRALVCGP